MTCQLFYVSTVRSVRWRQSISLFDILNNRSNCNKETDVHVFETNSVDEKTYTVGHEVYVHVYVCRIFQIFRTRERKDVGILLISIDLLDKLENRSRTQTLTEHLYITVTHISRFPINKTRNVVILSESVRQ